MGATVVDYTDVTVTLPNSFDAANFRATSTSVAQELRGRFVHPANPDDVPLVAIAHGNHGKHGLGVTNVVRPAGRDGFVSSIFPLPSAPDGDYELIYLGGTPEEWQINPPSGTATDVPQVAGTDAWVFAKDLYLIVRQGSAGQEWQPGDEIVVTVAEGADPSAENYAGYTYLQEHLASHGVASISVDLDDLSREKSVRARGWVLLQNIEAALSSAAVSGAAHGEIDRSRIILLGHSRGGEAVLQAYRMLADATERPDANDTAQTPHAITVQASDVRGIISVSPTTFMDGPMASGELAAPWLVMPWPVAPIPLPRPSLLLLYGGADGDVNGMGQGVRPFRIYDRAAGTKHAVFFAGANHNHFNTSWRCDDATHGTWASSIAACYVGPAVGGDLVAADPERDLLLSYGGAFIKQLFDGRPGYEEYFRRPRRLRPPAVAAGLDLRVQHHQRTALVVDDFETGADAVMSAGGHAEATPASVLVDELALHDGDSLPPYGSLTFAPEWPAAGSEQHQHGFFATDLDATGVAVNGDETDPENRFAQDTRGALLDLSAADPTYELQPSAPPVPPALAGSPWDLSEFRFLSFRIAKQNADPAGTGPAVTFTLEFEDDAETIVAVQSPTIDTVEDGYVSSLARTTHCPDCFPLASGVDLPVRCSSTLDWWTTTAIFRTFRFDLCALTNEGTDLDLTSIRKIRFRFAPGGGVTTRVAIDDIEFSKQ